MSIGTAIAACLYIHPNSICFFNPFFNPERISIQAAVLKWSNSTTLKPGLVRSVARCFHPGYIILELPEQANKKILFSRPIPFREE